MTKVVLLGAGNLASHLFKAFEANKFVEIIQVFNHREEKLKTFSALVDTTTAFSEIKEADFYIISVKDDAIAEVASQLREKEGIVLHTSGAINMSALANLSNYGVFYPLQSFSKEKEVNFTEIPIGIEANTAENLKKLKTFAATISDSVYDISSEQRRILHVAAVFANNFSNFMFTTAAEICEKHEVPFEILQPLIQETFLKIREVSPKDAQTGPAIRNDKQTMQAHLHHLNEDQKKLYKTISEAITKTYGKEL
ncbi:Rossmann-like and DUF2520 domain-containing protein [Zunongwangia endophytica]|uniref:Rossmann-like and DUF2520 domain-containing protein n=1 Tax=Zunongwangia endophytica TaxID=1808945 RepID=A0ABV8H4Z1_9FLAO|nr:DUF2520 domain-containing protein [Zunongwangia endophytica]MDN3594539.1 DUF2520 domain-containing protein [Zunongwangia endophytica]